VRHLKKWGFTPQKPLYKAYQQQPDAVKDWLDKKNGLLKLVYLPAYSPELNPE